MDREIENLETELRKLQETEIQRRDKVMITYQVMEETLESSIHCQEDDHVEEAAISAHSNVLNNTPEDINNPDDYPLDVVLQFPRAPSGSICVECSTTPSTHKCRRCQRFVCTLCCSEERHLDMIWWCGDCFDNASITNQQQIRDGKYESDGEGTKTIV